MSFSRRDYLRGVIDADGSVGFTGQGFPFVSLTTASTAIGAYLCHYAKRITGASRQIRRNSRDGIYNVLYTKEAAVQLAAHLYYPGCLALQRKKSAAASLIEWVRPAEMNSTSAETLDRRGRPHPARGSHPGSGGRRTRPVPEQLPGATLAPGQRHRAESTRLLEHAEWPRHDVPGPFSGVSPSRSRPA
ncbi:LAGLIDADG family homing endonuclease [Streptomyces sp. NPDC055815]